MLVDGYVRVSQVGGREGNSFISPKVQRDRITRWAELHGVSLANVYEELDQSGARADRPMLMEAIERVEAGATSGLVVARIDRFGRSLIHGLAAIDRIAKAGGVFVSVDDGLDTRNETGKLILRIMLSLAEWELDRVRQNWVESRRRALASGQYISPIAPVGYRISSERKLELNPEMAPWIAGAFQLRAQGESVGAIAKWLVGNGVPTATGGAGWAPSVLIPIMRSRVYLGELHHGDFVATGVHQPIIDPATFARAQSPHRPFPTRSRNKSLLSGLLRCAACRMCMASAKTKTKAVYSCFPNHAAGRCPNPASIYGHTIDDYVLAELQARIKAQRATGQPRRSEMLARRLADAENALAHYRDHARIESVIGASRFAAGLEVRVARVERAALRLAAAMERADRDLPAPTEWNAMNGDGRREVVRREIDCVFLASGRAVDIRKRIFICWKGEAPLDLPGRGRRNNGIKRFDPAQCEGSAPRRDRPAAFDLWPERRVVAEAREFLGTKTLLPERSHFCRAGRRDLYEQIQLQGGRQHWAEKLGLGLRKYRSTAYWTPQQIEVDLRAFVEDRREMPSRDDFEVRGLSPLWNAMQRTGGIEHWRNRLRSPDAAES